MIEMSTKIKETLESRTLIISILRTISFTPLDAEWLKTALVRIPTILNVKRVDERYLHLIFFFAV